MRGSAQFRRVRDIFVGLLGFVAVLGALTVPVAVTGVAPAGATTSSAGTDAQFRTAFATDTVNVINLTANITMNCGSGVFSRNNGALLVNGNGFTIDAATCATRVLAIFGTDLATFDRVKLTGGNPSLNGSIGGGAISSNGSLRFVRSTISANTVTSTAANSSFAGGGGIFVGASSSVTLVESTVSGNTATCATCTGGAIGAGINAGTVVLQNSTVAGNTATAPAAPSNGVGGGVNAGVSLTMVYSTVTNNTAASGANLHGSGTMTSFASVVAYPATGTNCASFTTTSEGYNHDNDGTCGFGAGTGDQSNGGDPLLAALADNGGPTLTRAPAATSPLIERIPAASCNSGSASSLLPLTDQRRYLRPQGARCDIGAVERPAGSFKATDPTRILDTRINTGLPGAFAPEEIRDLPVTGVVPVPASGVSAVLMNVTVTGATAAGWLTLFPADATLPIASNLNFVAGQTVPNLVAVKVASDDGKVSISNTGGNPAAGSVQVIADVVGYYVDATAAVESQYTALAIPTRILDTRTNTGLSGAFAPQQIRPLDVGGGPLGGIPVDAAAVVMNVTATGATAAGWLTLFPEDSMLPTASNLNFTAGQTVANLVTVKLGTGPLPFTGDVRIGNTVGNAGAGTVHVIADVVGYYKFATGTNLTSIAPQRILDTRFGTGIMPGPVAGQATILVDPKTATGLPAVGSYSAVIVNVTATAPSAAGWLTVFNSDDGSPPTASNINFGAGQTVPNLVKISVGADGRFKISNTFGNVGAGTVQIIADIVGYYT